MPANIMEHPEYAKYKDKWALVRSVINDNVKQYIIVPEQGKSRNSKRNQTYIDRAIFYNYTINTMQGLIGTAFQTDGKVNLPPQLEYLLEEATDNGLTLNQLARLGLGEIAQTGRWVIYTDYPAVSLGLSGEEVAAKDLKPLIHARPAEDLFNWSVDISTGKKVLTMAMIKETIDVCNMEGPSPSYTWRKIEQVRLFRLDDNGYYYQQLLQYNTNAANVNNTPLYTALTEPFYPRQNGALMTHIPLTIVGAQDNDDTVDESPLYPIAVVNIGHLRNSANYEDNLDAHGQGTLGVTSDLTWSQWQEQTANRPFVMGSREAYFLGKSGDMKLCQLAPNQEAANAMRQKEEQMVMMGAHLIMPQARVQPVETTRMQMGAQLSRLDSMVSNIEDGIKKQIIECSAFIGADSNEVEYELNHEYIPDVADPQLIAQIAASWQMGGIPHSAFLDYMRKVNLLPRDVTDEELLSEIGQESPLGASVGFSNPSPILPQQPMEKMPPGLSD